MFNTICNNRKGITLTEVVIALFVTAVGVMALMSLQPTAWRASDRSDHLGRAGGILHQELETTEAWIMNPCNAVAAGTATRTVLTSGQAARVPGDVPYTVTTTIANPTPQIFRVTVRVTWPGNAAGIAESTSVTRQEYFREGC